MSRRYDQSTTTFSPEGRLHQVEYAIEAINNAGTCLGLLSSDGVVLAGEKKVVSKLLAPSKTSEKTFTIDDHAVCLIAGLTSDANILIQQSRLAAQRFFFAYLLTSYHMIILLNCNALNFLKISLQLPRKNANRANCEKFM
jgi:20S proteasome subunit alpha 3